MGLNFLVFDAGEESICGDFMAKINGVPSFSIQNVRDQA